MLQRNKTRTRSPFNHECVFNLWQTLKGSTEGSGVKVSQGQFVGFAVAPSRPYLASLHHTLCYKYKNVVLIETKFLFDSNLGTCFAHQNVFLQLRYLQTLNNISAEKNSTIVFPVPVDIISNMMGRYPKTSNSFEED